MGEPDPVVTKVIPDERPQRRLRLVQVLTLLIIAGAFAGTLYVLGDPSRRTQVEHLIQSPSGLLALFVISAISNATLILPVPGLALTALAATVADPLVVGVVAGAGQTLGEMTGYLAGYSGQSLVEKNPRYARLVGWMRRFGPITIFVLALIPNPLFDVAGIIAGALRMPVWLYALSAGAGKIIKNVGVAYGAARGIEWLTRIFGG
ncbi:MAG TPA: VTT domain-containing protein [Anaerolineae bacterium]